ncbi:MAG: hypothetical protein M3R15_22170 [Acidobacteriota bacterium]|nr:hypothetical protein [Acidobacteriota bacterium]
MNKVSITISESLSDDASDNKILLRNSLIGVLLNQYGVTDTSAIDFKKKDLPRMTQMARMKYVTEKACHGIIALVDRRDLLPIN